jgi:hypothetical protein
MQRNTEAQQQRLTDLSTRAPLADREYNRLRAAGAPEEQLEAAREHANRLHNELANAEARAKGFSLLNGYARASSEYEECSTWKRGSHKTSARG